MLFQIYPFRKNLKTLKCRGYVLFSKIILCFEVPKRGKHVTFDSKKRKKKNQFLKI